MTAVSPVYPRIARGYTGVRIWVFENKLVPTFEKLGTYDDMG